MLAYTDNADGTEELKSLLFPIIVMKLRFTVVAQ